MVFGILVSALLTLAPVITLEAQTAPVVAETCTSVVAPPPELSGWTDRLSRIAATRVENLPEALLPPGLSADLQLSPGADLDYALTPERPAAAGSFGGLVAVRIEAEGVYRVALGSGAWIDVVRNGQAIPSGDHGHGPACSGVRKMVDFRLEPGSYILQISSAATPSIPVMIGRLP